jgi:hypothetical protein
MPYAPQNIHCTIKTSTVQCDNVKFTQELYRSSSAYFCCILRQFPTECRSCVTETEQAATPHAVLLAHSGMQAPADNSTSANVTDMF